MLCNHMYMCVYLYIHKSIIRGVPTSFTPGGRLAGTHRSLSGEGQGEGKGAAPDRPGIRSHRQRVFIAAECSQGSPSHICLCMQPCIHTCMHPCIRASVHPCIRVSMHPCIRASVSPCIPASVHPCIRVSVCPCIRVCMRPSIHPSVRPSIHPSIYIFSIDTHTYACLSTCWVRHGYVNMS